MSTSERPLAGQAEEPVRSSENLALLSQGLLTGIVRLQAGREHMPDAATFRRRTIKALDELDRDARLVGYNGDDIGNAQFAIVAFMDSVVLNSSEPGRAEWERQSLAMQKFQVADAGEVFFDKLDAARSERDSDHLADVLEVFLLCLLLGFEGRYRGGSHAELSTICDKVRRRIDSIRGKPDIISPTGQLPNYTPPPPPPPSFLNRYRLIALGAIGATVLLFTFLKVDLVWEAGRALRSLLPL